MSKDNEKVDLGTIFVTLVAIMIAFVIIDGILVEKLNVHHSLSTMILASVTTGLLIKR